MIHSASKVLGSLFFFYYLELNIIYMSLKDLHTLWRTYDRHVTIFLYSNSTKLNLFLHLTIFLAMTMTRTKLCESLLERERKMGEFDGEPLNLENYWERLLYSYISFNHTTTIYGHKWLSNSPNSIFIF